MIKLKNVTKYYNSNGIITVGLKNINLEFKKGEIVAITGDSGSGKSTLLNVISGVDNYEEGEIYFYDEETSYFDQKDMDAFRKNNVGFIYQKYNIIDSYTVLENVMLPLLIQGKSNKEAKIEAKKLLKEVNLINRIKNRGSELSGGEKQRLVIARALAKDSKILACDEPTGNLDSESGKEIINLIKKVSKDRLVLIVTHNYEEVKDIVTRKVRLVDGMVVEDNEIKEISEVSKESLDIKRTKVKNKSIFNISFLNIFRTPKKTLFLSLVYLAISAIFLASSINLNTTIGFRSGIPINDDDRIVVSKKDHSPIDKNDFNYDEQYFNAFYEHRNIRLQKQENANDFLQSYYLTERKIEFTPLNGEKAIEPDDLTLVMPENAYQDAFVGDNFYVSPFYLSGRDTKGIFLGKVKQIGTSTNVNSLTLIKNGEISEDIKNINLLNNTRFFYEYNHKRIQLAQTSIGEQNETIFKCPLYLKDKVKFKAIAFDTYELGNTIKIDYSEKYSNPSMEFGKDVFDLSIKINFDEIYEATIYVDNVNKASKDLKNKGYAVSYPYDDQVKAIQALRDVQNAFNTINIMILVILFFISFVIISRIFSSKIKDYGILRSVGLMNRDLNKIVVNENVFSSIIASTISLIGAYVILFIKGSKQIFYLDFTFVLLYYLLMIVFSVLIGIRFNHKVFKNSVNETIKEGELL